MSIAVLYESQEWSSFALRDDIQNLMPAVEVKLYDLETEVDLEAILASDLIVNRIFASAYFRGHHRSHDFVKEILLEAKNLGIPLLNSYEAHFYEINKHLAAQVMLKNNLPVPEVYGCIKKDRGINANPSFPCIVKPNCGGRTTDTHVVNSQEEWLKLYSELSPEMEYIVEAYKTPKEGFITRIEVIGNKCVQILKKTLTQSGLAAYHLGSEFYPYPECPNEVQALALKVMKLLRIEMGSLDLIEAKEGPVVIDVNSVSNTSEDCIEEFDFDLMNETAKYIAAKYRLLKGELYDKSGSF